jgi:hypothetical protein
MVGDWASRRSKHSLTIGDGYLGLDQPVSSSCARAKSSRASHPFKVDGQAMLRCATALARSESMIFLVERRRMPDTILKSSLSLFPKSLHEGRAERPSQRPNHGHKVKLTHGPSYNAVSRLPTSSATSWRCTTGQSSYSFSSSSSP